MGPIYFTLSICYGIIVIVLSRYFYPVFEINILPRRSLIIFGIALIAIGIPFWIISIISVMRAYNADKLVTDGIYRCCRHPVYASWTVFIIPGVVLLSNSWIGLTIPIFMYFLLRKLVKKEEIYLESIFGSEYLHYRQKVPCILPIGHLKQSYSKANTADGRSGTAD